MDWIVYTYTVVDGQPVCHAYALFTQEQAENLAAELNGNGTTAMALQLEPPPAPVAS